jgi:2-methylisocitrate lyase-like PEP mutase family enzyme
MASHLSRCELRTMLSPGAALLLPGVANALAARIVADQGFTAAYVTGAGIANTFLGVPDMKDLGYAGVIYANVALQAAVKGM